MSAESLPCDENAHWAMRRQFAAEREAARAGLADHWRRRFFPDPAVAKRDLAAIAERLQRAEAAHAPIAAKHDELVQACAAAEAQLGKLNAQIGDADTQILTLENSKVGHARACNMAAASQAQASIDTLMKERAPLASQQPAFERVVRDRRAERDQQHADHHATGARVAMTKLELARAQGRVEAVKVIEPTVDKLLAIIARTRAAERDAVAALTGDPMGERIARNLQRGDLAGHVLEMLSSVLRT